MTPGLSDTRQGPHSEMVAALKTSLKTKFAKSGNCTYDERTTESPNKPIEPVSIVCTGYSSKCIALDPEGQPSLLPHTKSRKINPTYPI